MERHRALHALQSPMHASLQPVRGLLLDLDGTLYVSGKLLEGTPKLFAVLADKDIPFLCLTNNSSASGLDYVRKLKAFGLDLDASQVLTSGQATAHHVLETEGHRSAYVVGTDALRVEFEGAGIALSETDPDCVVVAYDTTLDYQKLCVATRLLFAGKPYFATHPDLTCISDAGLLPDIAATIAGLEAVTGRRPVIVGKPEAPMVAAACKRLGLEPGAVAMVGDQLDTDMTMAERHGLLGILVLSGETDARTLESSPVTPSMVLQHVGELAEALI